MNIGRVIRVERESQGLSQMEISLRSGYSQANIARIELGRQAGGFQTITDILNALGLDIRVVKK